MTMQFWINWITAFLIVLAVGMICFAIEEYRVWKKGSK